jgi:hypothetical protein
MQIEKHFPDYREVRNGYTKLAKKSRPKLENWHDVQFPSYCLTIHGRDANKADSFFGEKQF